MSEASANQPSSSPGSRPAGSSSAGSASAGRVGEVPGLGGSYTSHTVNIAPIHAPGTRSQTLV